MKGYFKLLLTVLALILAALVTTNWTSHPTHATGPWYVAPGGDDGNDCLSPTTPCATINGAIAKASPGDTIYVAIGTYTGAGTEVVLLDKSVTISGGWNSAFSKQSGASTVDGEKSRRGITAYSTSTSRIENFVIQNGLDPLGGGVYNAGNLTLVNSTVSDNKATIYDGGGIYNAYDSLILVNSTVSGNRGTCGGGIRNDGTLKLYSSTLSNNTASDRGGGICQNSSINVILQNSILADNTAGSAPDCSGSVSSSGYNLVGNTSGCTFSSSTGDLTNVSPNLGLLIGLPGTPKYHPLLSGSPAINAGTPTGCTDHLGNPLNTDQRGVSRVGRCDIGAYEYITPGPANAIAAFGGTPQHTPPSFVFEMPLQALVLDSVGTPVNNVTVTFSAPASGASGTFADSGTFTTTAVTNESGIATASSFTANALRGNYTIMATVSGVVTPTYFSLGNLAWYVSTDGDDVRDCQTPATACASINGVLGKMDFLAGDTVLVASGMYTGTGNEVVLLNKSIRLLGGWDAAFTTQSGTSTIDGGGSRRGITVNSYVSAVVERFVVQNGVSGPGGGINNSGGDLTLNDSVITGNSSSVYLLWDFGGGISNFGGILSLTDVVVSNNTSDYRAGGIFNDNGAVTLDNCIVTGNSSGDYGGGLLNYQGTMVVKATTVDGNKSGYDGGGISFYGGSLVLNNSTVSGNTARSSGGGIVTVGSTLSLNSSTVSGNTAFSAGGIRIDDSTVTMKNSIVAGNTAGSAPECSGSIESASYNIIGNTSGCSFTPATGDLTDVNARLGQLIGVPGGQMYHPLLPGSPAINAGNPAGCTDHQGNPLLTDQRGVSRVERCDIGAYEYVTPGPAASFVPVGGAPPRTPPFSTFRGSLRAAVLDNVGSPVSNTTVIFAAPASGPSVTFADTGTFTASVTTDEGGVATTPSLTANGLMGSYTLTATASGIMTTVHFSLTNFGWYVAPSGNDANDCQTPTTPCATINSALGRVFPDDTVLVASGTYTGTGDQVVLIGTSVRILGGWNEDFTTMSGISNIDGQRLRQGITVNGDALVERFQVRHGYSPHGGGVGVDGTLILSDSIVSDNAAQYEGGGIYSWRGTVILNRSTVSGTTNADGIRNYGGNMTLNNSTVSGNVSGGIYNYEGTMTLNGSSVSGNTGGGVTNRGSLTLNSSTVSSNTGSGPGGGIANCGTLTLNSSTVSGNTAGGGIYAECGAVTMQNSILAGNTPDCQGGIGIASAGYNLVGDTSGCTFIPGTGDLTNVNAQLGPLIGIPEKPQYYPLLSGSPAIDAGNPAGCMGSTGPLTTDQRGAARVGRCDIGAYEYTVPGPAATIYAFGGTLQHAPPLEVYLKPLQAAVLDGIGSPVNNAAVTFSAPTSGASGTFADTGTYTTTATTVESGIATAVTLTANGLMGSYVVTATVGGVVTPANFLLGNLGWYVAPGGDDANDCQSTATACATINGALSKPDFWAGDTIRVAIGTYTGIGNEVVLLNKSATLSGGWGSAFATQTGTSTIDGQGVRRGIVVRAYVVASVNRFTIQNGFDPYYSTFTRAGGIHNEGTLTLNSSRVISNTAVASDGGAIHNYGTMTLNDSSVSGSSPNGVVNDGVMTLNNSTVSDNTGNGINVVWSNLILNNSTVSRNRGSGIHNHDGAVILSNSTVSGNEGGGIYTWLGQVTLNNSTVSGNTGGGIYMERNGALALSNCTVSRNTGGGIYVDEGTMIFSNTIIAGNMGRPNAPDCSVGSGHIASAGYNLIGNKTGCSFTSSTGDLLNVDPGLFPLLGSPGYHPLLPGSPAINAGNPAGCTDHLGNLLDTDQRGVSRLGRCDIGSYEYDPAYDPLTHTFLPVVASFCPDFFDDFSNPASGWEVGEDDYVRSEYLNGEYRILTKQSGYIYLFRAPICHRQNYVVEVDARWVGTPGASYGLIFGISGDFSQFYLFEVNTDYQVYWLLRGDPSGWATLVDFTYSPAIHSGAASNHLKVTRNGSQITLEVNGTVLGTWYDSTISGLTGAGLASSPYDDAPVSDARLDNFRVTSLTSGTMQQSSINPSTEVESSRVIPQGFPKVVTFN
jgi:hypothetical protein